MVGEVFLDGGFEFGDAFEDAASDAFCSDAPEEALDLVEPRRRCWGEVHMKTGMSLEPRLNLGVLVRGVIVGNQMHIKPLGCVAIDHAQKFEPFLMAMSLQTQWDDDTVCRPQRRHGRRHWPMHEATSPSRMAQIFAHDRSQHTPAA